jgi:hypothetical protein
MTYDIVIVGIEERRVVGLRVNHQLTMETVLQPASPR